MEKEYFVFVYGTLKRKEPNHEKYLSTSKFVTTACTIEKFPLVIASKYNIPFALDHPGLGKVSLIDYNHHLTIKLNLSMVNETFLIINLFEPT